MCFLIFVRCFLCGVTSAGVVLCARLFFLHSFVTKVCRSYSVWWKQVLVKKDPWKFLHGAPWKVLEEKTASIPAQGYYNLILDFFSVLTGLRARTIGHELCLTKQIYAIDSLPANLFSPTIQYPYSRTHRWRKCDWLTHGAVVVEISTLTHICTSQCCPCVTKQVSVIDSLELEKSLHLALIDHAPKYLNIPSFLNRLQIHDIMTVLKDSHACGLYHVLFKGTILQDHDCKR